jgi:NAD(P)-dependent dehydrogenase (short-subunit alcohol dehydrogenase family)
MPINRLGNPREVANAIVWLCSNDSSFVVGHALAIDGGWAIQ